MTLVIPLKQQNATKAASNYFATQDSTENALFTEPLHFPQTGQKPALPTVRAKAVLLIHATIYTYLKRCLPTVIPTEAGRRLLPRSSANESACAAEESLFDPSRKPPCSSPSLQTTVIV
jgi:hypothetical protein